MAPPTRAQISADVTAPKARVEILVGGSWIDVSASVVRVTPVVEAAGGEASGVAAGPAVAPTCDLELFADSPATLQTLRSYEGDRRPVRVSFGFGASDLVRRFQGVLMRYRGSDRTRRWGLRGYDALIEAAEVRSLVFTRRPAATATTLTSVEDPAAGNYGAGLVNYILWQCGGRPNEQAASYPTAAFYYHCTTAVIAPEYTWTPGDSPWEVLLRLCWAAGGQIYQDGDGVVRYVDPITLASGVATFIFTDEVRTEGQRASEGKAGYESITEERDAEAVVTGVTCNFTSRLRQGMQTIYESTVPRRLAPGAAETLTCETDLPIIALGGVEIDPVIARRAQRATASQVTVASVLHSAQRVAPTLTNTLAEPVQVDSVRVTGAPLAAGEPGTARYVVSGERIISAPDSPYVQSERHAAMLARMLYDAHANAGTLFTLGGCAYDPDRSVGEIVSLTSAELGLAALRCRITRITVEDGIWMEVDLAPLGNLPALDSVHRVGMVSGTKDLAY